MPDGKSIYVTEGVFRALHRKSGANPKNFPVADPPSPYCHSFTMADADHLSPGVPTRAAFELSPTSYLFRHGHRIRIAIALADSDHFSRIPDGRPPNIRVLRQGGRASRLILPVIPR